MAEAAAGGNGGEGGCRPDCKKTPWTEEEDEALRRGVREHGRQNWAAIALALPGRGSKSCRLRWCQHLAPELDSRPFTPDEDALIVEQQRVHGNKWATIARCLPGRSDNAVKNRWNSALRKLQAPTPMEHAAAAAAEEEEDNQDVPVCLELFPLMAGGVKKLKQTPATGSLGAGGEKDEEDAATGLMLGLPIASEAELALSLGPAWPAPA